MKKADFFATMHTAAPGSTPEAVQKMIDFAVECVQEEQYANFTPSKDPEASVERWRDLAAHRMCQKHGRMEIFDGYTITVVTPKRAYSMTRRQDAPEDSNRFLGV